MIPDFRGLPRAFWVLFAGTLVNRVGGLVLFFLAIYLTETRGLSTAEAGAVVSAYGVGAIVGGPMGGWLADRIGRRPTLIVSLIAGGLSIFVLGAMTSAGAIAAAAVATGLLYEMYRPVVSTVVADVVSPDDRPRAYSLIYWAVNLGASIAAIAGGALAAYSYRLLFAVDALTTAAYGVLVWVALPETQPTVVAPRRRTSAWRVLLGDYRFLAVCVLSLAFSIIFFQSFVGLPLDMRAHGISTAGYGALMAVNGLLIVLLQPLAGRWISGRSRPSVLALSSLLLGLGFGMNAWIGTAPLYAIAIAIWTLGEILYSPAVVSLVADFAPTDFRGRYQGAFSLAVTSAFAVAPLAGGYVIAHAGAYWLWVGCFVVATITAAGFLALNRISR